MPRQQLLKVEEVQKQVSRVWQELRKTHGMTDHRLDSAKIVVLLNSLPRFFSKEPFSSGKISRFEVGHKFVTEHLVDALRTKQGLTETEERLVRQFLGRAYHQIPPREVRLRYNAAKSLAGMGERGPQIYEGIKKEVRAILAEFQKPSKQLLPERANGFTLANPALSLDVLRSFENFSELAKYMWKTGLDPKRPYLWRNPKQYR